MTSLSTGLLLRHRRVAATTTGLLSTPTSSLPRRIISTTHAGQAPPPLDKGKRPEGSTSTHLPIALSPPRSFSTSITRSLPPKKKAKATGEAESSAGAEEGEAAKPKRLGRKPKASTEASQSTDTDKPKRKYAAAKSKEKPEPPKPDPKRPFPHLPKPEDWRASFKLGTGFLKGYRYFTSNPETAKSIIEKLDLGEGWPGRAKDGEQMGWTVIEGYAGPGTLTSLLLAHPAVDKVISMEDNESFAPWMETLCTADVCISPKHDRSVVDPKARLHPIRASAYHWETYTRILDEGGLRHLQNRVIENEDQDGSVRTVDYEGKLVKKEHEGPGWETISPILYVAQLPNTVHSEQLFAQIIHAVASRMWLFQHGRIKMAFVCAETLAMRCLAQPGDKGRSKLSVTVQSLCDVTLAIPSAELTPHHDHFYPSTPSVGPRLPLSANNLIPHSPATQGGTTSKEKMCMMVVEPKAKPLVGRTELEAFEYITRNVFVLRSTSVDVALKHVAPGAANILAHLQPDSPSMVGRPQTECVPPSTLVSHLTNEQWVGLARVFEKWPFRPQNFFEEGRNDAVNRSFIR